MEKGFKFVAMEEVTPEMLLKGGCREDYPKMQELAYKLRKIYTEGKTIRVTSELGTDLTASIDGRPGYIAAGNVHQQPGVALYCAAFPDGEVGIAPVEGTGEGVVVFDTTMHFLGRLKSHLKVKVSKGKAVGIEGDQAEKLQEILKKFGDEYSYVFPAEIAIGLNSKVEVTGSIRADKKLYGSVHIAFGMNKDVGGTTPGKLHIDGVIRYPDVTVDNRLIVSKGRLVNIP
jgi:leucyl aminopeptidase (aminopeptidase T)